MCRESFNGSESGASEIVGELMMITITVVFFSILSLAVFALMSNSSQTIRMNVQVVMPDSHTVVAKDSGGDSMRFSSVSIIIDGVEFTDGSSSMKIADTNDNGRWDTGESITVSIPTAGKDHTIMVYEKQSGTLIGKFEVSG